MFDCAFKPASGQRSIHYMGHIKMMGAVQPFISGAISKTVNVPKDATVDEIQQAYIESWRLGAKAISIYRDGSKRTQPLNTSTDKDGGGEGREGVAPQPKRRKLPDERAAITHKFDIAGHEGYITVGLFEDGQPGEIFLVMAKEGSTISGFADAFAQAISLRAAVRRAAAGARRQVQPRALRAVRHDQEPGRPLREVDRRLHLPVGGRIGEGAAPATSARTAGPRAAALDLPYERFCGRAGLEPALLVRIPPMAQPVIAGAVIRIIAGISTVLLVLLLFNTLRRIDRPVAAGVSVALAIAVSAIIEAKMLRTPLSVRLVLLRGAVAGLVVAIVLTYLER